ncbi:uncharacterized protein [Drosophila kikkawai]|uniref:Uncharacterized protein n=1 Tax=Drosophila kikkawai TaxID=30033 RepID=A0A6P4IWW2_DROKI|nr:uncharacterized protein LOC108078492 [Drosophila kikkawai]
MTHSRSARNWSSNLDSSHALRKYFYPKQTIVAASTSLQAAEHGEWPLNSDWQLARDPNHHAEPSAKKSSVSLPKKVERKIWAKPAMVELTKAAVRAERAKTSAMKFHEKLQAKKVQVQLENTEQPEKLQKSRAPLWQPKTLPSQVNRKPPTGVHRRRRRIQKPTKRAPKASAVNIRKLPKPEVSSKKTPSLVRRTPKPQAVRRCYSGRPRSILVVDASRPNTGGAEQTIDSNCEQAPRLRMKGRSKKSYGVPLCSRPTKILGMGYPYSRYMQMRREQLCKQPEYYDQYMRMLSQQQRQQEMHQLEQCYNQEQIQHQVEHQKKYTVPAKSPCRGRMMGKRLCGNFYYD